MINSINTGGGDFVGRDKKAARVKVQDPDKVEIGTIVHFVTNAMAHRPAIVTNTSPGFANLVVFMDGSNDGYAADSCVIWVAAVPFSNVPSDYSWHFIEPVQ